MSVCVHRLGVVDTSTGPECVYCQTPICIDCLQRETHPDHEERCRECQGQHLVGVAEARVER